jgi:hypothetical protein
MFSSGGPSSAVFFGFFLSHIACNNILLLLIKSQILSYCKCVDDILSTYGRNISDIDNTLLEINRICAQLIFRDEYEMNNSVKFLDVTLIRRPTDIGSNDGG